MEVDVVGKELSKALRRIGFGGVDCFALACYTGASAMTTFVICLSSARGVTKMRLVIGSIALKGPSIVQMTPVPRMGSRFQDSKQVAHPDACESA